VSIACYLANRSPYSTLRRKTLYKALNGYKPNLKHIRIIGFIAYNLVGHYKKKLITRANKGKLISYKGDIIYYMLILNGKVVKGSNIYINKRILENYKPLIKRKESINNDLRERSILYKSHINPSFKTLAKRYKITLTRDTLIEVNNNGDELIKDFNYYYIKNYIENDFNLSY
jgi:hypothetical protein